jgi:hypothetical protein
MINNTCRCKMDNEPESYYIVCRYIICKWDHGQW